MNFRDKLARMMYGRYGVDTLSKAVLYTSVGILAISLFIPWVGFNLLAMALLFLCYVRMFSKNFSKRQKENAVFLKYFNKIKYRFSKVTFSLKQNKTHHIYRCPNCKQKIRVPRGKGKISIRCPKCQNEFIKHS